MNLPLHLKCLMSDWFIAKDKVNIGNEDTNEDTNEGIQWMFLLLTKKDFTN